jgi:hypothetical protein
MDSLPPPPPSKTLEKQTANKYEFENTIKKADELQNTVGNLITDIKNKRDLENALNNRYSRKKGGSKRNKKSVRRLVKKRNTKTRKSRRVKH